MSAAGVSQSSVSPIRNPRHLIFVNKYQQTGFTDPIKAYQEVYGCNRSSAKVSISRLLTRVELQQEIQHRIEATGVVTKDSLVSDLTKYRSWAEEAKDYDSAAEISVKLAKLLGLIVDKSEVKTLDEKRELIRQLVADELPSPN